MGMKWYISNGIEPTIWDGCVQNGLDEPSIYSHQILRKLMIIMRWNGVLSERPKNTSIGWSFSSTRLVLYPIIWGWVKTLVPSEPQNSWDLWMIWMFIPLKMDDYRYWPIPIYPLYPHEIAENHQEKYGKISHNLGEPPMTIIDDLGVYSVADWVTEIGKLYASPRKWRPKLVSRYVIIASITPYIPYPMTDPWCCYTW